eukprot:233260-Rhodomonas_salina.1
MSCPPGSTIPACQYWTICRGTYQATRRHTRIMIRSPGRLVPASYAAKSKRVRYLHGEMPLWACDAMVCYAQHYKPYPVMRGTGWGLWCRVYVPCAMCYVLCAMCYVPCAMCDVLSPMSHVLGPRVCMQRGST